jgi:hypothetical protein
MSKKGKIILASILGVAAVVVTLWNLGVFESAPKPPPPPTANMTPDQKVQFEKEQQQLREQIKKRPPSGA